MKISVLQRLIGALILLGAAAVHAEGPVSAAIDEAASGVSAPADAAETANDADDWDRAARRRHHRHGSDLINIGHDAMLAAGEQRNAVVSIFGSAVDEGDAVDVVSILGNTRVTGVVRNSAVAVLGNSYIDGKVDGDTVTVLGNIELGPHANVGGQVVAVLGTVRRDPDAVVQGDVQNIFGGDFGASWLHSWIDHALLYGRPLSLHAHLGWAWGLALGFLALYACIALLFRTAVSRCVQTLDARPGHTLLAAIVALLMSPVLFILLCVTLIGIAGIPFVAAAFLCAWLFGKAVMLAWLGGRVTGQPAAGPLSHPAVAVLAGGAVVLLLYLVPVLGFLVFQLLGIFGFGAVVYTLVLATREHQAAKREQSDGSGGTRDGAAASASGEAAAAAFGGPPGASSGGASGVGPGSGSSESTVDPANPASSGRPAAPPPAAGAPVTAAMPRAGFWIRMAALFLDVILVGFVAGMLHHVFNFHLVMLAIYGAVMWKLRGSTVGGIVFDLRVVRLDGREVDWETAIVRALACFLSLAVAGLGFIWIAIDDANQAWHDKIAGTVVVRVPRVAPHS